MQLKTVGESLKVIDDINSVFSKMENYNGLGKNRETIRSLKEATSQYSTEAVKAAIAQSTLNEDQIEAILSQKGLKGEILKTETARLAEITATNAETAATDANTASTNANAAAQGTNAAATNADTVSQEVNTASTWSLKYAYDGLASSLGITTTALTAIIGVLAAVGVAAYAIKKYNDYIAEQNKQSRESARTIQDQNKSLDENISKIKELRERLNDANVSESEAYDIKTQLYEIQKQLIETYGDEAEGLRLVNGELTTQIDKLRTLSKEKAIEWQRDNKDAIKRATNEMTQERYLQVGYAKGLSKELFQSQVDELQKIVSKYESQGLSMNVAEDINNRDALQYTIDFTGDVTQAEKVLDEFSKEVQKTSHDLGSDNNILLENVIRYSSSVLEQQRSIIENNIDSYRTNLQAEIAQAGNIEIGGRTYNQNKVYGDYLTSVEEYNKALATGNGIDEAKKKYENLLAVINKIIAKRPDFEYLFNPDVVGLNQTAIDKNSFSNMLNNSSFYKNKTEIIKGLQDIDLETNNMSEDQINAFNSLIKAGENYSLSLEDIIDILKELGIIQGKVSEEKFEPFKAKSVSDTVSELDKMVDKWETVNALYSTFKKNGVGEFDSKSLNSIVTSFNDIQGVNVENFLKVLTDSSSTATDVQNAFDKLATEYIYSSDCLKGLTDATAEQITKELELQGIENASVLVTNYLAAAKVYATEESKDLADATTEEILAFINEENATNEVNQYLAAYALQKELANGVTLTTDGDIENIKSLMQACGEGVTAIIAFQNAKSGLMETMKAGLPNNIDIASDPIGFQKAIEESAKAASEYKRLSDNAQNEINSAMARVNSKLKANTTGAKDTSSSGGGNSSTDRDTEAIKEEFNWIERLNQYLERQHKLQQEIADDETTSYSERIDAIKEMINVDKQRQKAATDTVKKYEDDWKNVMKDLSAEWVNKIMFGKINIEELEAQTDEEKAFIEQLKKAIEIYDNFQQAIELKNETEKETNEHIREQLELELEIIEAQKEQLDNEMSIVQAKMDYIEASGGVVTAGYYEEQIRLSEEITDSLEDQIDNLNEQIELVDEDSAEYYSLLAQINDCEKEIIECKTQQAEWNEAIKRLPVERLQKYINMLKAIKQELDDFLAYQETIGQPTTKDQYQQLIQINEEQIKSLQKQASELQGVLGDYKYGSTKFNEIAEELSDIQNETANLVNEMQEYNNQILNIPIENLQKVNEELERYSSVLSGVMSDYDSALDAVLTLLDDQNEAIEKQREETEKLYEEQIEPLQDSLDLLEKANTAREKQISLEKAQYELEKARNQKTTKVKNCLLLQ